MESARKRHYKCISDAFFVDGAIMACNAFSSSPQKNLFLFIP